MGLALNYEMKLKLLYHFTLYPLRVFCFLSVDSSIQVQNFNIYT